MAETQKPVVSRKSKTMDGNNAAAYVSYAFTEVAGIYPITPSSPMADYVDQWSAQLRLRKCSPKQVRQVRCTVLWRQVR